MLIQQPVFSQLAERPDAHCATLVDLPDGSLLAAWFSGAFETATDVAILCSRLDRERQTWSAPRVLAQVDGHSMGQPVFLQRPSGELWFFFVVVMGRGPDKIQYDGMRPLADWTTAQPYWQRSIDGGRTWTARRQLFDYPGLMLRSRPLVLPGRIILPAYDENSWESRMLISDDEGATWRLTAPIHTPPGNIHACLVARADGSLLAYLRTGGRGGFIWRTESDDGGESWREPTPTTFPNPNSGLDLLRLSSGRLVLAYNHSNYQRTPLCVALGEENETWRPSRTLEDAQAEFSYPALCQTRDGLLHMVYSHNRTHIQYARFTEEWLRQAPSTGSSEHNAYGRG